MDKEILVELKKLKELIEPIGVCMFTTMNNDHKIFSRPMTTIKIDDEFNIWFFTNEFSEAIHDVSIDNTVDLIYAHPGQNSYAHVKGVTSLILDHEKKTELWNPLLKAWYPKGIDDPKLCLLKVSINEISYWSSSSNRMVAFFKVLKAIAKRETFKEGEQAIVKIK